MIAPVGKSGPFTCCIRSSTFASGLSISVDDRVDDSPRWCGGMFVAIPTAIPARAVDEQVREPRRQDERLALGLVVVRAEVDGVRVELAQHLLGEPREARLRVAHRGRRIVVDRAEVALAVDERVAQRERLRQAHERVVDRRVAVRVMVAHHVADDVRALHVGPAGAVSVRPHRVEHAAVDGLQTVAHVGQRAADDDRHRVVEVARAHLLLELARLDAAGPERAGLDLRHPAAVYTSRNLTFRRSAR